MFLGLIIVIVFSIFLSIYFKKRSAETLFASASMITLILYLFGLFKIYMIGIAIISLLSIVCLIYVIVYCIKNRHSIKENIDFSIIGFLALFAVVYYIVRGSKIICLDEFTAWGLFTKDTFYSKELYLYSELPALAKNYQAGTAIFQSFFEILNFNFAEDIMLMANNIIYLSLGSFILKNKSKLLQFIISLLIILIVPLTMLMWPTIYYTILVDIILGFVFAYILFYYFDSKIDTFMFINIALGIFFVSCSKLNGILLALVSLSIIYFDLLVFKRKDFLGFIKKAPKVKKIKKNLNIKKTIIILLPIFSLIFTYVSWNVAVNLINIKTNSSTSVLEILFAFKNPSFMARMPEFLATVKNIFVNYKYFILLTISLFMVVFNLIKVSKAKKIRYGIAFLLYLLAKVAYVLFLFLVCSTMINSFIAVEALRRYLYTLVAADIFLITYTLVQLSYNLKLSSIALLFLMVLFSTTDANYQVKDFISKKYTNDSIEYREQFNNTIEYLDDFDTENNIVYIISKTESIPYMFNYELTPETVSILNHNNINKIMNKKKYFVYSLNITTKEEQKFLNRKRKGDIYIYIYDFDEKQKVMYKNIFESPMENNRMYKISNINGVYKAIYSD